MSSFAPWSVTCQQPSERATPSWPCLPAARWLAPWRSGSETGSARTSSGTSSASPSRPDVGAGSRTTKVSRYRRRRVRGAAPKLSVAHSFYVQCFRRSETWFLWNRCSHEGGPQRPRRVRLAQPGAVADRLERHGGVWHLLLHVCLSQALYRRHLCGVVGVGDR